MKPIPVADKILIKYMISMSKKKKNIKVQSNIYSPIIRINSNKESWGENSELLLIAREQKIPMTPSFSKETTWEGSRINHFLLGDIINHSKRTTPKDPKVYN